MERSGGKGREGRGGRESQRGRRKEGGEIPEEKTVLIHTYEYFGFDEILVLND